MDFVLAAYGDALRSMLAFERCYGVGVHWNDSAQCLVEAGFAERCYVEHENDYRYQVTPEGRRAIGEGDGK